MSRKWSSFTWLSIALTYFAIALLILWLVRWPKYDVRLPVSGLLAYLLAVDFRITALDKQLSRLGR